LSEGVSLRFVDQELKPNTPEMSSEKFRKKRLRLHFSQFAITDVREWQSPVLVKIADLTPYTG
jgi:hypothetical protein